MDMTMDGMTYLLNSTESLDALIASASRELKQLQRGDGHWVFELEADTTIPAEYILYKHYFGEIEPELEAKIAVYLREAQGDHGGWPLFEAGDFNMSASVKAYYALKLIGDDVDAPHMRRAREAILREGGAARANVFTRFALALFGQVPWRAVPVMPVELILAPKWFPFSLSKMAYWSRTVIAPLLILMALKPRARNPRQIGIRELFVIAPERETAYNFNPTGSFWGDLLLVADKVLRVLEPVMPRGLRQKAIRRTVSYMTERLNGEDGLGAIFPAMVNATMAFDALGYPADHPDLVLARKAVDKLLVVKDDRIYCQPCVSPVWDTSLSAHALMEAGEAPDGPALREAFDWLKSKQILDKVGDWADSVKHAPRPGGWAFQYGNDHFPDVDDTAVVAMALHRSGNPDYREAVERAAEWIIGLQSKNGGWGAYDADNTNYYLNHIPFADHGALLDPPTADVSARCIGFLVQMGYPTDHPAVARGIEYLLREQEPDGSWYGRWGANYVYGTWSVLAALNACGFDHQSEPIRRAVDWLVATQRADGGWGEDCATYWSERRQEAKDSTPSQTAWGVLALMAAGEVEHEATRRGIAYLQRAPRIGARWHERLFTGVGFPRMFYLRYHGYAAFFPLWAVSRYRNLMQRNDRRVEYGI